MLSIYIIYFNNSEEVVALRVCENYADAEKSFEETAQNFVKTFYADADRNQKLANPAAVEPFHPIKIIKYAEDVNSTPALFLPLLKADSTFPAGMAFVRKRHEAFVYEKIYYGGWINSCSVKYLGRIGVLVQDLQEQSDALYRLKDIIDAQEISITKKDAEIKRLEYTNDILERSQTSLLLQHTAGGAPRAPTAKPRGMSAAIEEITLQKEKSASILKEIEERTKSGNLFKTAANQKKRNTREIQRVLAEAAWPCTFECEINDIASMTVTK